MDQTTKLYYNSTDKPMNVLGVDVIKAHEAVSVTAKYQPTVILENYPGLLDVTDTGVPTDNTSPTPKPATTAAAVSSATSPTSNTGDSNA